MTTKTNPNPLHLSVKSLRTFRGMEGQGFSAVLYVGTVRTAQLVDDGNGGMMHLQPLSQQVGPLLEKAAAWAKSLPAVTTDLVIDKATGERFVMSMDLEQWINAEVDRMQNEKRLARLRVTRTLFRLNDDPADTVRTVNTIDAKKAAAFLDNDIGAGKWSFI